MLEILCVELLKKLHIFHLIIVSGYTAELTQSHVRGIGFVAGSILVVCVVCVVLGAVKNREYNRGTQVQKV